MRFEKLNENKIKITLNNDELEQWHVNLHNISRNSQAIQDIFWQAMKRAENEVGFSANGSHLVVEATSQESSSEFSMLVTKVNKECIADILKIKARKQRQRTKCILRVYKFRDFEHLCAVAKNINVNFVATSGLYKYNELFFLEVMPKNPTAGDRLDLAFIEFAQIAELNSAGSGFLREYGSLLIPENALEILSEKFS